MQNLKRKAARRDNGRRGSGTDGRSNSYLQYTPSPRTMQALAACYDYVAGMKLWWECYA